MQVNLKLEQLREAWQELVDEVASREHQIVQMMELLGNFESNFTKLDTWIEDKVQYDAHNQASYNLYSFTRLLFCDFRLWVCPYSPLSLVS